VRLAAKADAAVATPTTLDVHLGPIVEHGPKLRP
jgi:hypothetical protein